MVVVVNKNTRAEQKHAKRPDEGTRQSGRKAVRKTRDDCGKMKHRARKRKDKKTSTHE